MKEIEMSEPVTDNVLVKILMSQMGIDDPNEVVRRLSSGEWMVGPVPRWREENGVIYITVKNSASGVIYKIALLKGESFSDEDRTAQSFCKKAREMNLTTPNAEVVRLMREQFSDKELEAMGLWWVLIMHDPDGEPSRLASFRTAGGRWFLEYNTSPFPVNHTWPCKVGVVFMVP